MLRIIRFLLFIIALMIAVYQAGAQDVPPPPFTLYAPGMANPDLFRMDYTAGCGTAGLSEHYLILTWWASEWNPLNPNPDTTDRITYEVVFRIDSALADGTPVKVERSIPSNQNGTRVGRSISGQEMYDLLWTDGVPVEDRTDSLVMEVQYYVVATCTNHGLKTYSDTAGVSIETVELPHVTPPLVVSINRPPEGAMSFLTPRDGEEIYHVELGADLDLVWRSAEDINYNSGIEQSLFNTYSSITHMWETEVDQLGYPRRTVDTVEYMWYGVVTEAWPAPSPATGMAIVKNAGVLSAAILDNAEIDAIFHGILTDAVDSVRIEHCVLAKDAMYYGTIPAHGIFWPYNRGIWANGLQLNIESDTLLYSEFGCAPHIVKGACGSFTLKKGRPTSVHGDPPMGPRSLALSAYPNPFSSSTAITYNLPERSHIRLAVYDMLGREVALLREDLIEHGTHTLQWSPPAGLPRGNYMLVLSAGGTRISTPIVMHQ